jgi:hypothetical protein
MSLIENDTLELGCSHFLVIQRGLGIARNPDNLAISGGVRTNRYRPDRTGNEKRADISAGL